MIVSITGGGGFIGKQLVDRCIQQGYQVRLLTRHNLSPRKGVKYFVGDLLNIDNNFTDFVHSIHASLTFFACYIYAKRHTYPSPGTGSGGCQGQASYGRGAPWAWA